MADDAKQATGAYAEVEDLEARWRALGDSEAARAEVLLADASVFLASVVERYGVDADAKAGALKILCCDWVQRKMEAAAAQPLSSVSMQANGFMQTLSYAGKASKFRLFPEDLELLGVGVGGQAASMFPYATGAQR